MNNMKKVSCNERDRCLLAFLLVMLVSVSGITSVQGQDKEAFLSSGNVLQKRLDYYQLASASERTQEPRGFGRINQVDLRSGIDGFNDITGELSFKDSLWGDLEFHYPAESGSAFLEVSDADEDLDGSAVDSVLISLTSELADSEWVYLYETSVNSGAFRGEIGFDVQAIQMDAQGESQYFATQADGLLQISRGDWLRATYFDAVNDWGVPDTILAETVYGGWWGQVSGTWTASGNPYVIVATAWVGSVLQTDTLRIEPGVRVEFLPGTALIANSGLLEVAGVEGDSVYCVKKEGIGDRSGFWDGIHMLDGRLEMSYAVIVGGRQGIYIHFGTVEPAILSNSRISDCEWVGVDVDGFINIVNCIVSENQGDGIHYFPHSRGIIVGGEVSANGGVGIEVVNSAIQIECVSVTDNGSYGVRVKSSDSTELAVIHHSTLFDNALYDVVNLSAFDIDARWNWWGDTTTAEMNAGGNPKDIGKIYDVFDDGTRGMVNYSGWLDQAASCDCGCLCHADPKCDDVPNILDIVSAVAVGFRNEPNIPDVNTLCPVMTTDVDCDGDTDVFDIVKLVNVAFRNEDPAANFCDPCASSDFRS